MVFGHYGPNNRSPASPDPPGARITSDPPVDIPRIMDPGYPSGSRITDHLGSPGGYFRVVDPGYSQGSRITDILERSIQYPPDGSPPIHRRLSTNGESRVSTEITRHLGSTGGYPRLVPDHGPECDRQADIVATQRSTHSRIGSRNLKKTNQTFVIQNYGKKQAESLSYLRHLDRRWKSLSPLKNL